VRESNANEISGRLDSELASLRDKAQFRALEMSRGLNLCSNDYLGLSTDPRLKTALLAAVAKTDSLGSTGSRLLSGNSPEWEDLESDFASFAGTEAALYFGSGYAANVGLLSSILRPGDLVFSDALNHASLVDGIRLSGAEKVIYPHVDLGALSRALQQRRDWRVPKVIVTETLFSMDGDCAPLDDLLQLAEDHDAELIVDEAHATGVRGPQGRGLAAERGLERRMFAITHTCGKALASAGAFVCGGYQLKEFLINRARTFIFTTAMPPYFAGQIRAALDLACQMDSERLHLQKLANRLHEDMGADLQPGSAPSHITSIVLGSNEKALYVAERLQASGFDARAIRPPTVPAGTARIRLSLTCKLTLEDVSRLAVAIRGAIESASAFFSTSPVHA
jgi:8-amino-7-oxononanoate synthase